DVLRALAREPEQSRSVVAALAKEAAGLPGVAETLAIVAQALEDPDSEAHARFAVERLALLAAAAALAGGAPADVAEAFAQARLATSGGRTYGTAQLEPRLRTRLTERALPR